MARKKTRRTKTAHPGVTLKKRKLKSGVVFHFARYKDPDSGKFKDITLSSTAFPTKEARRQWAIRKSQQIAKRRADIDAGVLKTERTPIEGAIDDHLASRSDLREATRIADQNALKLFLGWIEENGIQSVDEITPGRLEAFKESRIRARRQVQSTGKRGARKSTQKPRSPATVNHELRPILAMLNRFRRLGLLAGITRDELGDSLKPLKVPRDKPDYLPSSKCRKLLEAALRHDAETFQETRAEHSGLGIPGETPKYQPIAPFVAFMLLSGCHVNEALALKWESVDLEATDQDGKKVGEIVLHASETKTRQYRVIGLEVSPALGKLLASLKLRAGQREYVFGGTDPLPRTRIEAARKRLIKSFGAPRFSWQNLRQTCGTFLSNAPGIFSSASVFRSAAQLGHSVQVAERHYLGVERGIPRNARTLEAAMQIEDLMRELTEHVQSASDAISIRRVNKT